MNTIVGKQNLKIDNMYSNSYIHTLKRTIIIKTESISETRQSSGYAKWQGRAENFEESG